MSHMFSIFTQFGLHPLCLVLAAEYQGSISNYEVPTLELRDLLGLTGNLFCDGSFFLFSFDLKDDEYNKKDNFCFYSLYFMKANTWVRLTD